MKSPFPGMDPYVEPHWRDVHASLVVEARRVLNRLLPVGLIARVEERLAIESGDDLSSRIRPDVRVVSNLIPGEVEPVGGIAIEAPYRLVLELDPQVERFIQILDESGQLITVIEFISPSNKRSPGMEDFRQKRAALLSAGVHVVEVDLVRAGNWRELMRPELCPSGAVSTYCAVLRIAGPRSAGYLFPITLREALPDIPIPLRAADKPVPLALQACFTTVYEDGRYDQTIDYSISPEPPLNEQDSEWAEALLRKQ